jgi:5-formyltetrahydrofolate cyclo-ligase
MNEPNQKGALRPKFIELLKRQTEQERIAKSRLITDKFFQYDKVCKARTILFYASFEGEVDTFAMMEKAIQLKKRVALPIILRDQRKMIPTLTDNLEGLERGAYGICQPCLEASKEVPPSEIDVVVLPGLAFDKSNIRLGRGAGYYDRFLTTLPASTTFVGLCFDFQLVDCLPQEPHDIAVHRVLSN